MKVQNYLNTFNQIISRGEKGDGKYILGALSAWHDIEGYTCYIGYKDLTMTIYFHNRFSYQYDRRQTLEEFERVINKLLEDSK